MPELLPGIIITLVAGFLQGTFALFLKYMSPWKWENFWVVYSIVAMVVFPISWALLAIPNLGGIMASVPFGNMVLPLFFGSLWGIGSVLFGLSVVRIGLALTYSIIIGMTGTIGTILPLFINNTFPVANSLLFLVMGLSSMLAGIVISGYAGSSRERLKESSEKAKRHSKDYLYGLLIAIFSGVASPMLNIGFVYGRPISEIVAKSGVSAGNATLPVWIVVLLGGFVINIGYAMYLLLKNRSFKLYSSTTPKHIATSVLSGMFWFGGFGLFGIATVLLGALGTSAGWAILMSSMIVISNLWGILSGEWKKARGALSIQLYGIAALIIGIVLISFTLWTIP